MTPGSNGRRLAVALFGISAIGSATVRAANSWTRIGPEGAIVNAISADPTNPAVVYAATEGGGIFRTVDGGTSWFPAGVLPSPSAPVDPTLIWEVRAIAVDPSNPSTVWAGANQYLFRSTDGGATWTFVWSSPNQSTGGFIWSIKIDPGSPTRLYVGKDRTLVRSIDGGASWQQIYAVPFQANSPRVTSIAVDPFNRDVLYVGVRNWSASKSVNGGAAWTSLPVAAHSIAIDPTQTQTVYAGRYGSGLIKSLDGGTSWNAIGGAVDPYVSALVLDPASPATLYAATDGGGVFKSSDSGSSWNPAVSGLTTPYLRSLAISPGRILLGANGAGVFASFDGASTWVQRNTGLFATRIQRLARSGGTLLAGAYGINVFRRAFAGGETWTAGVTALLSPVFYDLAGAPAQPGLFYAATPYGLMRSSDNGDTWVPKTPPGASSCAAAVVHPTAASVLYAACFFTDHTSVMRTSDGGDVWSPAGSGLVAPDFPYPPVNVFALAINPFSPAVLYAATDWGIYQTLSSGASWSRLVGEGAPSGQIADLTIDPSHPQTVYAVDEYAWVYKTIDSGLTWTQTPLGWSSAVAVDPTNSAIVYAASLYLGIQKSVDGGATWSWIHSGLVNKHVTSLLVDPTRPSRVFAGIDAGGVVVLDQTSPTGSFYTVVPCRLVDTRNQTGPLGGPALAAGASRDFLMTGECGVPPTARAVSVNMTIVQPTTGGHLTVWSAGDPLPLASSMNYRPGQVRANNAIVSLGAGNAISVFAGQESGTVQFILDVNGYFE